MKAKMNETATSTRPTTTSNEPTADSSITGGGGSGGAPLPGAGGNIYGPNDNYVAAGSKVTPALLTLGGLAAGVGLLIL